MTPKWDLAVNLLSGPLLKADVRWPLVLMVQWCDLRPRFLPKNTIGRGHRAISRNGRALLASDRPLADLAGKVARARLQTWHRAILQNEPPRPYGLLLCLRSLGEKGTEPEYETRLVGCPESPFDLAIEVGGCQYLEFRRIVT
jgi:hypothetical protein